MTSSSAPIGFVLSRAAKVVTAEFEIYLFHEQGKLSEWLILLALSDGEPQLQGTLAEFVGVQGPTLTHHLNRLEREGYISRQRREDNRRVHDVSLTQDGRMRFESLKTKARAFDESLKTAISSDEMDVLRQSLAALARAAREVNLK